MKQTQQRVYERYYSLSFILFYRAEQRKDHSCIQHLQAISIRHATHLGVMNRTKRKPSRFSGPGPHFCTVREFVAMLDDWERERTTKGGRPNKGER